MDKISRKRILVRMPSIGLERMLQEGIYLRELGMVRGYRCSLD